MSAEASRLEEAGLHEVAEELFLADRWAQLQQEKNALLRTMLLCCAPFLAALESERRDLMMVEVIGSQAISEECSVRGASIPFSDMFGEDQDVLTDAGFCYLITLALRIQVGGTMWFSPLTATWLPGDSVSASRTPENPGGDTGKDLVHDANLTIERCTIVGVICWLRGVPAIENPTPEDEMSDMEDEEGEEVGERRWMGQLSTRRGVRFVVPGASGLVAPEAFALVAAQAPGCLAAVGHHGDDLHELFTLRESPPAHPKTATLAKRSEYR